MDALRRARRRLPNAAELTESCQRMLERHHAYVGEHLEDMPEIRDWTWASK
jgi:xylulose-5-phosphate/fructose-6-phosphate phosphoketolase